MRLFVPGPLQPHSEFTLPPAATRHAQVRRVQPGDSVRLFDGGGNDWPATVLQVTRSAVAVRTGAAVAVQRELRLQVTLALGMPANERMDTLVEKATELGVAQIQPLLTERSVLRLTGERAERKREHWQAVAEAACEQCGRAVVPVVAPVRTLVDWLQSMTAIATATATATPVAAHALRLLLNPTPDAPALHARVDASALRVVTALSGPEGGLTPAECAAARAHGFVDTNLGPRVLRADTAPLAVLAWLALQPSAAAD